MDFKLHAWNSNLIALICGGKYKNYITLGISSSTYIHYSLESSESEWADGIKLLSLYYMSYINMEPFPWFCISLQEINYGLSNSDIKLNKKWKTTLHLRAFGQPFVNSWWCLIKSWLWHHLELLEIAITFPHVNMPVTCFCYRMRAYFCHIVPHHLLLHCLA